VKNVVKVVHRQREVPNH